MRAFKAETLTALHERLCHKLANGTADDFDMVTSVDVQIHDVMAHAESMDWEFDLKTLWLTPSRWSMMVRQYLDPDDVLEWVRKIEGHIGTKGRGIAALRTKSVKARGGASKGNKETRRWGSCMLAVTYKALPSPQITLYSRTSYLGYIGALDLTVAWALGQHLAQALGVDVADFGFTWFNQAVQFHGFKSVAYLICHPDPDKAEIYREFLLPETIPESSQKLVKARPALRLCRAWLQKVLKEDRLGHSYGVTRYNTYRRVRRRLHTEVYGLQHAKQFEGWSYYQEKDLRVRQGLAKPGEQKEWFTAYKPLPHTKVDKLDLSPIGLSLDEVD